MRNPYLSDDHILISGDAAAIDGAADDVFAAVFNLLDGTFGGELSGAIADNAARYARRRLTAELEVYDPIAVDRAELAAALAAVCPDRV